MSTPSNPSSIMIYKIVKDFENEGRTIHSMYELECFAKKVFEFANSITNDEFWILDTPEIKEDLERLCDVTASLCEFSETKFIEGGKDFAKRKVGQMPYSWLKGAVKVLQEIQEDVSMNPNRSTVVVNYPNGEKLVSSVSWDRGTIIVDEMD